MLGYMTPLCGGPPLFARRATRRYGRLGQAGLLDVVALWKYECSLTNVQLLNNYSYNSTRLANVRLATRI